MNNFILQSYRSKKQRALINNLCFYRSDTGYISSAFSQDKQMFRSRIWLRTTKKSITSQINKDLKNISMPSDRVDEAEPRKRKIEQSFVDSNHDIVKKRRKAGGNSVISDRISDLPEPIIHLIFSSMKCTKDVARTTVLSKKWKNNFNSYLTFDFDERWFRVPKQKGKHNRIKARELQKKKFKSYVEGSLRTRLDPAPCIDKFKLYVNNIDKALQVCMESWVCSALSKNVKELDIQVDTKDKHFVLPGAVLMSSLITSLKLSGSIQSGFTNISLSNLRQLSIKGSNIASDSVIKEFETSCPLLEDLRLVSCIRIIYLSISSLLKLKRVEVHECVNAKSIEIAGPKLETFLYQGDKHQVCKIDLKGSANLRNLTLRGSKMTGTVFQDFVSKYPFIENLELFNCSSIERVTILSERLKCLALIKCSGLKEVNIDAPNMYSLEFSGHKMPFTSVNVLGLREAKFSFSPSRTMSKCMDEYHQFFGNFDRSKGFKLIVYSDKCMKIYEEPREAREVGSKLELTVSITCVSKAVDNWLQSHGRSIVLVSPSSELIKSTQTMIMQRGEDPSCCSLFSNKCWRHYLEDVEVLNLSSNQMHYNFKWKSRPKIH